MELTEARALLLDLGDSVLPAPGRIRLEHVGAVARLIIDNPGARGAVTLGMMVDLADAVIALQGFEGAGVVLCATDPRVFCAGGYLPQVVEAVSDPPKAIQMATAMATVTDALGALPVPSVAAVRGLAIGGGAELLTATDLRVVSPDAAVRFVHGRLGIVPGWGGTARLVRQVGRSAAMRILLEAGRLEADELRALGLADAVDVDPEDAALRWLTSVPVAAVRALKRQVGAPDQEAVAFAEVWGAPAHRAALEGLRKHL